MQCMQLPEHVREPGDEANLVYTYLLLKSAEMCETTLSTKLMLYVLQYDIIGTF